MNDSTISFLHELNNCFYREQGASFAQTRGAPWHGWKRCLDTLHEAGYNHGTLSVLDIACGNKRFEAFLRSSFPEVNIDYYGVDNSDEMSKATASQGAYQDLDILNLMLTSDSELINEHIQAPPCDIVTTFGFMHHVPSQHLRKAVLDAMIAHTKPDGLIIGSFWQFLKCPSLARKAEETHACALADLGSNSSFGDACKLQDVLDEGDYFLGWQNKIGAYRYCHSFSEGEIDELLGYAADKTELVARFEADGRTQNLNSYIILQRKPIQF